MFKQFVSAAKILTRQVQPGMSLKVRPDDTFLVSYPKSGNTWMRFLIANLLQPNPPVGLLEATTTRSQRVQEDPRRPGGLPHNYCSIPDIGKSLPH